MFNGEGKRAVGPGKSRAVGGRGKRAQWGGRPLAGCSPGGAAALVCVLAFAALRPWLVGVWLCYWDCLLLWPLRCPLDMSVGWACGRARGRGALREGPSGMGD